MKRKTGKGWLLGVMLFALAGNGYAATGTITISGKVLATTCTVKVNNAGTGDGTVVLPTVSVSDLTSGETAGDTSFTIDMNCSAAVDNVKPYFEPTNVDAATGYLVNTAGTGGAKNVEIQLLDHTNKVINLIANDATAMDLADDTTATQLRYTARYYASGADAVAGTVSTSAVYTLNYQ